MNPFIQQEWIGINQLILAALHEDLQDRGDLTSQATIPASVTGSAALVSRKPGVLAGFPLVAPILSQVSTDLQLEFHKTDGCTLQPGDTIAIIQGPMRSLLTAERTVLNFLQHLSGIATLTRQYVERVAGTKAQILDTRKTTPGWRMLEKYAVAQGGGTNHRLGLYDGILIKDNHLAAQPSPVTAIASAMASAREFAPGMKIEIEVDTLDQLRQALAESPDIVLLDNMTPEQLQQAVTMRNSLAPKVLLEASGGVNLDTVRSIAETGVDRISVGAITHSAPALDIGLDYTTA